MKSTRKRNKWRDARNRLLKLTKINPLEPDYSYWEPAFDQDPPRLKDVTPDLVKLRYVLGFCRGQPEVYSFVLQTFLAYINVDWPDGVFTHDFSLPDRGRCFTSLSINSWYLYKRDGFGWRKVAKRLIPEEYKNDPAEATNKVRKAAESFKAFRESVLNSIFSSRPEIRKGLEELLWDEGLYKLACSVMERKLLDGLIYSASTGNVGRGFPLS